MSAEENAVQADAEANTGDVTSPEASAELTESKPEVTSSDHVTDGIFSPIIGSLFSLLH